MPRGFGSKAALGLAVVSLALFFLPALTTSAQFLSRDAGRMHAPTKLHLGQSLAQGRLEQWNSFEAWGTPRLGNAVDAVLHPFNLLLLWPFPVAFKLWTLLSFLGAWIGAFVWARRVGTSAISASVAGAAFALCGHLVSSSDNQTYLTAYATLPWLFAALDAFLERPGPGRLALVGAASALAASAGDPQSWGLAIAAAPLYALAFGSEGRPLRRLALAVPAVAAAALAAAPAILPVLWWLPETMRFRASHLATKPMWDLAPLRLPELVVPHVFRHPQESLSSKILEAIGGGDFLPWAESVYLGVSVVLLAAVGAWASRRARWFWLAALGATWMAMGSTGGFLQIARHLPVLTSFRYWEKLAIWPALFLSIAAALGLEAVATLPAARAWLARFAAAGAVGLGALLMATGWLPEAFVAFLGHLAPGAEDELAANLRDGLLHAASVCAVVALLAGVLRSPQAVAAVPVAMLVVVLLDLGAANARAYLLFDPAIVWPTSSFGERLQSSAGKPRALTLAAQEVPWLQLPPRAAWSRSGARLVEPCWNVSYGFSSLYYYGALHPRRGADLSRHYLGNAALSEVLSLGAWSLEYLIVPGTVDLERELGLKPPFPIVVEDEAPPSRLVAIPHRERAYLAEQVRSVDARGAWRWATRQPMAGTESVIEGAVPADYRPPKGTAAVVVDEAERVEVLVEADSRALLILNDQFAPGWTATVDGRPVAIEPANWMVRGVWVDSGRHVVAFRYRTPGLLEGFAIASAGALALGAWALLLRRRTAALSGVDRHTRAG